MIPYNQLTSGVQSSTASTYTTAAIAPGANRLILVAVVSKIAATTPNTPTVSGLGLTWDQVATVLQTGSQEVRLTLFRAMSPQPISSGALTISFGGQNQDSGAWGITEFINVKGRGNNGADAIVQAVTSTAGLTTTTVTLSAFANSRNAAIGFIGSLWFGTTQSPGSGFTQLFSSNSSQTIVEGEYDGANNTSITWTQSGSTYPTGAIGIELASLPQPGGYVL